VRGREPAMELEMREPWMREGDFQEWMDRVDAILSRRYGMTSEDLPDCAWRDWHDDGCSARAAAQAAVRAVGCDA